MNQFAKLLILIFIASSLRLSASEMNRVDTIGKFNEVTDIELRIKKIANEAKVADSLAVVLQDSVLVPIYIDSLKIEEIARLPKKDRKSVV